MPSWVLYYSEYAITSACLAKIENGNSHEDDEQNETKLLKSKDCVTQLCIAQNLKQRPVHSKSSTLCFWNNGMNGWMNDRRKYLRYLYNNRKLSFKGVGSFCCSVIAWWAYSRGDYHLLAALVAIIGSKGLHIIHNICKIKHTLASL